jgi:hypothetical protein
MCVDFEARIANKPVVILHFDCVRVGADGFAFLKPEDEGGLGTSSPATLPGDDEYDEVTEESNVVETTLLPDRPKLSLNTRVVCT